MTPLPSQHETLSQGRLNDGAPFTTIGQHWTSFGSTSRVCWAFGHKIYTRSGQFGVKHVRCGQEKLSQTATFWGFEWSIVNICISHFDSARHVATTCSPLRDVTTLTRGKNKNKKNREKIGSEWVGQAQLRFIRGEVLCFLCFFILLLLFCFQKKEEKMDRMGG